MTPSLSWQLLVVLAHFLWQATLVAALLGVGLALLRGRAARVRYGSCVAALLMMAVCPAATFLYGAGVWDGAKDVNDKKDIKGGEIRNGALEVGPGMVGEVGGSFAGADALVRDEAGPARFEDLRLIPAIDLQPFAPYVLALYLSGVSLMLLRLAAALGGGKRLRRFSEPVEDAAVLQALARQARALGLKATPAVAWCGKVLTPTVVGVLRPMVLLPASAVTGLAPGQLELLLLHELAHVRRYDPLVNVLQRLIEAALFFHPAVWYVSRQVRLEREQCCDDVVLAHGGEPRAYAESLLQAATLAHFGRSGLAAAGGIGALGGGTDLRKRMRRVLGLDAQPVRLMHGGALLCLLAAGLAAAAFAGTADLGGIEREQTAQVEEPPAPGPADANTPLPSTEPSDALAPTATAPELIEQLKDEDWWLRKIAAQQLAYIDRATGTTRSLIEAMKDENVKVRAAAAESLGKRGDPQAIKHLVAALKEEPEVQKAAVEALQQFDEERVLPILRYAATDENLQIQAGAIQVLGGMKSAAATDLLVSVLASVRKTGDQPAAYEQHRSTMSRLAESLKQQPGEQVEPRLRALAESEVQDEVYNLLEVLGWLDKPEMDDILVRFSQQEDTRYRAINAAASQVVDREGKDSPELVEILRRALRAEYPQTAAEALRKIEWEPPTPEDRAWLHAALGEWDKAAELGDVAVEPLLQALHSVDRHGFSDGPALALGRIGDPRALPGMREKLAKAEKHMAENDRSALNDVAVAIVSATGQIGGEGAVDILIEATRSADPAVRWAAADALGRMKAEEGVPAIIEVMRSTPPGRGSHEEALIMVLDSGADGSVEAAAGFLEGLSRLGSYPSLVEALVKCGTQQAAEALKLAYQRAKESRLRESILAKLRDAQAPVMQRLYQELNPKPAEGSAPPPPVQRN